MSRIQVQPCTGFGAADVVGALVVGAAVVVGAFVVGATVVGGFVVGAAAFVVGAAVVAGFVVGAAALVVGAAVVAGFVVGAAALVATGAVVLLVVAGTTGMVVAADAPPDAERVGVTDLRAAVVAEPLGETACAAAVPRATAPPPASGTAADAEADGVVLADAETDAEAFGGFTVATSSTGAGGAATATVGDAEVQEPAAVYAVFRALPHPVTTTPATPTASSPAPTRSGRRPVARVIERIVIGPAPPGIVAAELPRHCTDRVAASG